MILKALENHGRDLSELVKKYAYQWAAYQDGDHPQADVRLHHRPGLVALKG
jgi:hypothetical protein